jgi:hypothetical protein
MWDRRRKENRLEKTGKEGGKREGGGQRAGKIKEEGRKGRKVMHNKEKESIFLPSFLPSFLISSSFSFTAFFLPSSSFLPSVRSSFLPSVRPSFFPSSSLPWGIDDGVEKSLPCCCSWCYIPNKRQSVSCAEGKGGRMRRGKGVYRMRGGGVQVYRMRGKCTQVYRMREDGGGGLLSLIPSLLRELVFGDKGGMTVFEERSERRKKGRKEGGKEDELENKGRKEVNGRTEGRKVGRR